MPPLTIAYSCASEKITLLIRLMGLERDKYGQVVSRIADRYTRDSVRLLVQQPNNILVNYNPWQKYWPGNAAAETVNSSIANLTHFVASHSVSYKTLVYHNPG